VPIEKNVLVENQERYRAETVVQKEKVCGRSKQTLRSEKVQKALRSP
jgi:hypothetical protein